MPRIPKSPLGVALVLFRVWGRLTPGQRRMAVRLARAHGPRIAAGAAAAVTARARRSARRR